MPRGQPDDGIHTQTVMAAGISDPGEAAARMGAINVWDRRGWTVWMDDFEGPAPKWTLLRGVGEVLPVLSSSKVWMGTQSLQLTTTVAPGAWTRATNNFPLVRRGKVGIELWVYLSTFTPGYFAIIPYIYDGTNLSIPTLYLDSQAKTATILASGGNFVVATNCFNSVDWIGWIPVKLVVDMDTDRYVRLLIGPDEIDLSAYAFFNGGATTERVIVVGLLLAGGAAGVQSAYVDNFILTSNEP